MLIKAWEKGCKFDGWSEFFKYDLWLEALEESHVDGEFYANRYRELDEVFPWDFIDSGVSKEFLIREYKKAIHGKTTDDCRNGCRACGITNCSMRGVYN